MELLGSYSNLSGWAERARRLLEDPIDSSKPKARFARQRQVRLNPIQVEELCEAYVAGSTVYELAGSFGVHRTTVLAVLKREGVARRNRRITADEVREATRLYASGLSVKDVGQLLSFNGGTIWRTLRKAASRCATRKDETESDFLSDWPRPEQSRGDPGMSLSADLHSS